MSVYKLTNIRITSSGEYSPRWLEYYKLINDHVLEKSDIFNMSDGRGKGEEDDEQKSDTRI